LILSGFDAIASKNVKILILGSMPSATSLSKTQYYAHPQNSFWFIIESLFANEHKLNYQDRIKLLEKNHIAVWDVLKNCVRLGSLDSAIEKKSMVANDFNAFFTAYPSINTVFFNGAKSETEYKKQVYPHLFQEFKQYDCLRLPSTSPAMATLKPEQKLKQWSIIKECLKNNI
jgi:TDG/mug DNA glycosylase family protein